jgi:4-amino-4-deoxy-L-arabinose transferase-like glycosyltransferase
MVWRIVRDLSKSLRAVAGQERVVLPALIALAFLIRLSVMIALRTYEFPSDREMGYEMGWIADNLARGEGFRVGGYYAWMAPVYPYILSVFFRLLGSYSQASSIAILVMQSCISSLTVAPLYHLGKRLFGRNVALVAAILWALDPASLYYSVKSVWSSALVALGLVLILLLFARLTERRTRVLDAVLCGLAVGLTALSDPVVLVIAPLLAIWLLWRAREDRRRAVGLLGVVAITAVAVLTPWTVRNYRIFNKLVLVKSTFGVNLWQGNHGLGIDQETAGLGFWTKVEACFTDEEVARLTLLDEVERDHVFGRQAADFIVAHLDVFARYTLSRVGLFWGLDCGQSTSILDRTNLVLVPLSLLGIVLPWRRQRDSALLLAFLVTFPIPYYVTHADFDRFRFPIEGPMLILAAYALCYGLSLARSRARGSVFRNHREDASGGKRWHES